MHFVVSEVRLVGAELLPGDGNSPLVLLFNPNSLRVKGHLMKSVDGLILYTMTSPVHLFVSAAVTIHSLFGTV